MTSNSLLLLREGSYGKVRNLKERDSSETSLTKIANHPNAEVIQTPDLALDGIHVQQCLSGVLSRTIASINYGNGCSRRSTFCRASLEVAQNNNVSVALDSSNSICSKRCPNKRARDEKRVLIIIINKVEYIIDVDDMLGKEQGT